MPFSDDFKDALSDSALMAEELIEEARKKPGRANLRVAADLIAQNAPVDARDAAAQDDRTALMWCAIRGHAAFADMLIAAKAPLDARDGGGNTALMLAIYNRQTDVARKLLAAGAAVGVRNNLKHAEIDYARLLGDAELVTLIEAAAKKQGVDLDAGAHRPWATPRL